MELRDLFDRQGDLTTRDAERVLDALIELWNAQAPLIKAEQHSRHSLVELDRLEVDLEKMHHWFNPTATGRRLRDSLQRLKPTHQALDAELGDLIEQVDHDHALVSPEGRVAMWVVAASLNERDRPDCDADGRLWLSQHYVSTAWATLTQVYRRWNRQRLRDVTGLLREETSTLRPSVIGLLLVLLINRNTSRERRLPAPSNATLSTDISNAIAEPALAFVQALSAERDSRADARGLEVYRGWAIGEISRRLGTGLHREDGIWLDENTVPVAEDRLVAALVNRPADQLAQVPRALDVLLAEYQRVRPELTTLGIAHERPSVTRRLVEKILGAVRDGAAVGGSILGGNS